jgi:hypothetical protein
MQEYYYQNLRKYMDLGLLSILSMLLGIVTNYIAEDYSNLKKPQPTLKSIKF